MKNNNEYKITLSMNSEMADKLKLIAERNYRSLSQQIRIALIEFVERNEEEKE